MIKTTSFSSLLVALFVALAYHITASSAAQVIVESSSPLFQYGPQTSDWAQIIDSAASGGSYHVSNVTYSVALIQYKFRSFTINTPKWPTSVPLQIRIDDTPYAINLQDTSVAPSPNGTPASPGKATVPAGPVWTYTGSSSQTRSIRIMGVSWQSNSPPVAYNVVDSITFETD